MLGMIGKKKKVGFQECIKWKLLYIVIADVFIWNNVEKYM